MPLQPGLRSFNAARLLVALALPAADRPEREPHEPHPPSLCSLGAVQACVEENQLAGNELRTAVAGIDIQLGAASAHLEELRRERDDQGAVLAALSAEATDLSSEISFLAAPPPEPSGEILLNFPTLEEFFGLTRLERQWQERYPGERAGKLSDRLRERKTAESSLKPSYDAVAEQFQQLSNQIASWGGERSHLVTEVGQHAVMCNGGCHDQVCGTREP